jgi:hypothetical protein
MNERHHCVGHRSAVEPYIMSLLHVLPSIHSIDVHSRIGTMPMESEGAIDG